MKRIIKSMENKYLLSALDLVEKVFTESENIESGKLVRGLVEEIRAKKYYVPECLMVKELVDGVLEHVDGSLEYSFYDCLRGGSNE